MEDEDVPRPDRKKRALKKLKEKSEISVAVDKKKSVEKSENPEKLAKKQKCIDFDKFAYKKEK